MLEFKLKSKRNSTENTIHLVVAKGFKKDESFSLPENKAIAKAIADKREYLVLNNGDFMSIIVLIQGEQGWKTSEKIRSVGAKITAVLNEAKSETVALMTNDLLFLSLAEGMALANYQFIKYKQSKDFKSNTFKTIHFVGGKALEPQISALQIVVESTCIARDLVNEPQSFMTALQLSEEFKTLGKKAGFKVDVWNEAKISAQKMGGILAVNKGSKIPPTFNIMEYKPKNAQNKQPIVLVGKGIVYDTGGLSLKPTTQSMDFMKCDMAGSAVVAGVLYAVAQLNLPLHIIGLVPATDNWIGEDSYAPGDVITMYDGTTVEVLNTDAEGRLVLADALHYAKKLKPQLVVDFATLTGAAVRAIGPYASAMMGTADDKTKQSIFESSYAVYERLIEFPLWDDYADELKSSIADMTNLGKGEGGQISAAKFLEHFTDYPWMHIDIAGTAFNHANKTYNPIGGTGVCVRLMIDFLQKQIK